MRKLIGVLAVCAVIALTGAAGWMLLQSRMKLAAPELSGAKQMTFNGRTKDGLSTDGQRLYFGQDDRGVIALAAMPVKGGPVKVLWRPKFSVVPVSYSATAKALLLLAATGGGRERQVWVYPLDGGQPHQLGNVQAHAAVWSPNGKRVAYASGRAIYVVNADGSGNRELVVFQGIPEMLEWGQDAKRLHFRVREPGTEASRMLELVSKDGMNTFSLKKIPWQEESGARLDVSPAGRPGTFVMLSSGRSGDGTVFMVRYRTGWGQPPVQVQEVKSGMRGVSDPAVLPSGREMFVLHSLMSADGAMEIDPKTQQTRKILKGDSVGFTTASHDGKWIAWVGSGGKGLWMARTGSSRGRSFKSVRGFEAIEYPSWSPDGRRIAFMGKKPGQPWRDYLLDVSDGSVVRASEKGDGQGAPTWSPDGKELLYGMAHCEQLQNCALKEIDLATRTIEKIPGSDGLTQASWSPDGNYVAALEPGRHRVMLFHVAKMRWKLLAKGIDGGELIWSPNSKYVYTDTGGTDPRIVRISVRDGAKKTVQRLSQTEYLNLKAAHDAVFSPGPHGTLIVPKVQRTSEVYGFQMKRM